MNEKTKQFNVIDVSCVLKMQVGKMLSVRNNDETVLLITFNDHCLNDAINQKGVIHQAQSIQFNKNMIHGDDFFFIAE